MACSGCETFTQAALPSRPIERARPGPGLLAHGLVSKYTDPLPLCRQSRVHERERLDRSTLPDWLGKSTALPEPLADAIGRHVPAGQAIFVNDAPRPGGTPSLKQLIRELGEPCLSGQGRPLPKHPDLARITSRAVSVVADAVRAQGDGERRATTSGTVPLRNGMPPQRGRTRRARRRPFRPMARLAGARSRQNT